MNTENNNALATANDSALGFETIGNDSELLGLSNEEKERILEADAKLMIAMLPMVTSSDLLNVRFNILDAVKTELIDEGEEKDVIVFVCENETGVFTVTKSKNKFNAAYAESFSARRGRVTGFSLKDMTFVSDENWGKRGNNAIVLRKWQPTTAEKPVTPKGDK